MDPETLFGMALGLMPPWQIKRIEFSTETARLDIYLDFLRGATFPCPTCGVAGAKAYDTAEEVWRHLHFFQYAAYLHARLPRVQCPGACGIKTVAVPWARPDSGFTRLFEALIMVLAREMPVAAMATLLGEHDTRLWRVIHHYVEQARAPLAEATELSRRVGDPLWDDAGVARITGEVAMRVGDCALAAEIADDALARALSPRGRGRMLNLRGIARHGLGDFDGALAAFTEERTLHLA